MIEEFYKKLPAKAKSWVDDNWRSIQEKMIEDIATFVTDEMNIHNCDECDELYDYDEGTICGDCDHCSSCGCVCEEDCLAKNPRCSCGLLLNEDDMRAWDRGKSKIPMCEGCLDELKNEKCDKCYKKLDGGDNDKWGKEHGDYHSLCDVCYDEEEEQWENELKNKDIQALLCETVKELVLKDQTVS